MGNTLAFCCDKREKEGAKLEDDDLKQHYQQIIFNQNNNFIIKDNQQLDFSKDRRLGSSTKSSPQKQQQRKQHDPKKSVEATVNFIHQQLDSMNEDDDLEDGKREKKRHSSVKQHETPGGKPDGPSDEENIVILHPKKTIDKFFAQLKEFQQLCRAQTKKYFVPAILCNSPRNLDKEAFILLRNCDELENYEMKHMKKMDMADSFKLHEFVFQDSKPQAQKEQLLNDLQNLFISDGLEIIGAFN